ncbi:MAG: hypothetical protein GDA54_00545 [Alphaproteobacteria bacterium GM7ARS4]|nr:hypothetical protein [Alphaproteobacteria bacterium GM7ARS4]
MSRLFYVVLIGLLPACEQNAHVSYFPLSPGQIWQYDITLKPGYEVEEHMVSIRRSLTPVTLTQRERETWQSAPLEITYENITPIQHENDTLYYYRHNEEGTQRIAFQASGGSIVRFDMPQRIVLHEPLTPGHAWDVPSQTFLLVRRLPSDMDMRATVPFAMRYTIDATDVTLRLHGQRYDNVLRVQGEGKTSFLGERGIGTIDVLITETNWYAPNVGLVKMERTETTSSQLFGKNMYTMELTSHQP